MATSTLQGVARLKVGPFRRGLRSLEKNVKYFSRNVAGPIAGAATEMARLAKYAAIAGSVIGGFGVKKAFDIEEMTMQFELLYRNSEKARKHVKAMADLSAVTPFDVGPFIQASRMLQIMGGESLNNVNFIKMMGDAAAMASADIQEVATWTGQLFAGLKSGGGVGRGGLMLMRKGLLGPDAYARVKSMAAAGEDFSTIWAVVTAELSRANGSMARMATGGKGLYSTLKGLIGLGAGEYFKGMAEQTKDAMAAMISKMNQLRDDGSLKTWGANMAKMTQNAMDSIWTIVVAWKNLDDNTRAQLKSIAAVTGAFLIAWKTGFISAMARSLIGLVRFAMVNFAMFAGALVALSGLVVGYKLGKAMDKAWNLSDWILSTKTYLTTMWQMWDVFFSNLGGAAILFGQQLLNALNPFEDADFSGVTEKMGRQFDLETDQILNDQREKFRKLDLQKELRDKSAKDNGIKQKSFAEAVKDQFSLDQLKKDLMGLVPDSILNMLAELKKAQGFDLKFPPAAKAEELTGPLEKGARAMKEMRMAGAPLRGIFTRLKLTAPNKASHWDQRPAVAQKIEKDSYEVLKKQLEVQKKTQDAMERLNTNGVWA